MKETAVVILAAGGATRMSSCVPKYLHQIGGRSILDYILETCSKLNFSKKILVTSPNYPLNRKGWESVTQKEAQGTGSAVLSAKEALLEFKGNVIILYSDSPFISIKTIENMSEALNKCDVVSLAFEPQDAAHYGRIVTNKDGFIEKIVEFKNANDKEKAITLCNGGNLMCSSELLFSLLDDIEKDKVTGEYLLTDIIAIANKKNKKCGFVIGDESEVIGVNTREDLANAELFFQQKKRKEVMNAGVTLLSPETTFFSYDTFIGKDVIIEPFVSFAPGAFVPSNTRVNSFTTVSGNVLRGVTKYDKIFSLKMLVILMFVTFVLLAPFLVWMNADEEKRGLCLHSLEMCLIHSKNIDSSMGVVGCAYSNFKCLVTDMDLDFEDADIEIPEDMSSSDDLEEFLKQYQNQNK